MTGLSRKTLLIKRAALASLVAAASCVAVALACRNLGIVFNFTHSAPFGLYRRTTNPTDGVHLSAPYAFFCPDQRWPGLHVNPNTRRDVGTCPDGYAALLKPVAAWPGDTVTTSAKGLSVNGTAIPNSAPLTKDGLGRQLHPYPFGQYRVPRGQIWVLSTYSKKSFDSRYFGPVPLAVVMDWVRPLLTERYNAH